MGFSEKDLSRETTVYYSPACMARPLSWHAGAVEMVGSPDAHDCGFVQLGYGRMLARDLPTEFFNHELMACDCDDFQSLQDFVTRWGFPYSPFRYSSLGARLLRRERDRRNATDAMELTDSLRRDLHAVISLAEVKHAIGSLQWAVAEMRNSVVGNEFENFTPLLNAATCNALSAGVVTDSKLVVARMSPLGAWWETERLTSAVCNQMVEAMADEAPWRICACEGCGIPFKRKQSRDSKADSRKNSKYCSEACQQRQKKRNMRASANNRIDHGL